MRPPGREEVEHCYVASKEGEPGAFAVCADIPEYKKRTADFVSAALRKGHTVNRVTTEEARTLLQEWLQFDKQRRHARRQV